MTELEFSNYLRSTFKPTSRSLKIRSTKHGAGINDADYLTTPRSGGKQLMCPAYISWANMIMRAYSPRFHEQCPTYIDVEVCNEWKSFMSFRDWWSKNQVDGWQLDKDLLSDEKIYSPETCIFVPQWLNKFTTDHRSARGTWPIGVHFHKRVGMFMAQCRNPILGKNEHIGYYPCPHEAHNAWLLRKLEFVEMTKDKMDSIDVRIYPRAIELLRSMK